MILSANRWYHVVGIIDADDSTMRMYIDGNLVEEVFDGALASGIRDTTGDLIIGNDFGFIGTGAFKGEMDDLRIYDRVLSQEEIDALVD